MPISIKNISDFKNIEEYFKKHYPSYLEILSSIPIITVPEDLWKKFRFNGYGYVVRTEDLLQNQMFLELASNNQNYYKELPSNEHKRDVNLYRIWKNVKKDLFLVVREGGYSFIYIVHELAHLIDKKDEFEAFNFDDEYLDQKSEQFSHLNEIRFAINNGMGFEEYFKNSFPDAYDIIKKFETGNRSVSEEEYNLSKMDERDYKKMWDYLWKLKK